MVLGETPADAWYDTSGVDRWTAPDQRGSGAESQLVADFTGDGRADVVVDGQDWGEDMAYGGVVLFPGGTPGGHTAPGGGEGTVLYGACQEANPTNQMEVRPLGDVTGDGAVDLAVLGGRAQPAGERFPRGAVWVLSDVGALRGPASLTSVATAIIEHRYGKGEAFVFAGRPADVTSVPDLDGNGVDELLLSDYYPGELYLFLGPVTGLLDVGQASLTIVGVDHPVTVGFGQPILAADLDGDGLSEIIVADRSDSEVTVISGARLRAALP